jgi:RNA-directed DNA polymerase
VVEKGRFIPTEEGTPQGGLCAAAHNPPYEQRRVMHSVGPLSLVTPGSGAERCT